MVQRTPVHAIDVVGPSGRGGPAWECVSTRAMIINVRLVTNCFPRVLESPRMRSYALPTTCVKQVRERECEMGGNFSHAHAHDRLHDEFVIFLYTIRPSSDPSSLDKPSVPRGMR